MSSTAATILQQIQLIEETIKLLEVNNQRETVELKREELRTLYQRLQAVNSALNENRSILKG
jgi:uncharacterized coiled-coil protein SlyX